MTNDIKKAARSVGADERPASQDAQRSINFNSSITKEPQFCMENFSSAPDKLVAIDGETLMELRLPPTRFCVQTLLSQGLTVLSGSPKIGKSWLTLELCVRVAKGEPLWSLPTTAGTTLYLCLEDTFRRIQDRLLCITDEAPANAFFAVAAPTLAEGLADQIRGFAADHPDTVLIAVDTFQVICGGETETSYAVDYNDGLALRQLARELGVALVVVHHLRKQGDADPLNKVSGTTGITGAADTVFVLDRGNCGQRCATLICTGRDIPYRELRLNFDADCRRWLPEADSLDEPNILLPQEMIDFVSLMKTRREYHGGNTELTELFNAATERQLSSRRLKQLMNKWRDELEQRGLRYDSHRSNGQRLVDVFYTSDASDVDDAGSGGLNSAFLATLASLWLQTRCSARSAHEKDCNPSTRALCRLVWDFPNRGRHS